MIVFDPGLNELPHGPRTLRLPLAYRRWIVDPHNSVNYILNGVAQVAHATPMGLDAVHFMGHGGSGFIQLGREALSAANVALFRMLRGRVRVIVFFSCSVGAEHRGDGWYRGQPTTFGQLVVRASGATTIVAQEPQYYSVGPGDVVDFGEWEGSLDVWGVGTGSTYPVYNPFHRAVPVFNLEEIIFR